MNDVLKWLDNFWYHYKWHVIVGLFVVVFLFVAIGQMIEKDKVDAYVMYAGPVALNASQIEDLQDSFEAIMADLNGDGKKNVQLIDITVLTDGQIEENRKKAEAEKIDYKPDMEFIYNMRQKLNLQLVSGDAYIVLIDPNLFAENDGVGIYKNLESLGVSSDKLVSDTAVEFKSLPIGSYFEAYDVLPDDTLLCFRELNVTAKSRGKKEKEKYERQLVLFKEIVNMQVSADAE